MATAYRVIAPCVIAKDKFGLLHHYYGTGGPAAGRSVIPWLSDDQASHFLAENLVELIEIADDPDTLGDDLAARVTQCIKVLDGLGLPADCGAPAARDALREDGQKFSNAVIAAAIKQRKGELSGTGVQ